MIFKGPEVEYCNAVKFGNLIPFYKKEMNVYKRAFPDMFQDCPVRPGHYYVMNFSSGFEKFENENEKEGVGVTLPNGRYRYTLKVVTKKDPSAFYLAWQKETRERLGEEDF